MGFSVSSIYHVTSNLTGYYIYLVNQDRLTGVAQSLLTDHGDIGDRTGKDSAYVRANSTAIVEFEYSLFMLLESNDWLKETIGDWSHLPAGIIITKPSLEKFDTKEGNVFIYASGDVINKAYSNPVALSQDIIDLCRNKISPTNAQFIKSIIKYSNSTLVDPTKNKNHPVLKAIYDSLMLEPNFYGLGFDFKEFFAHFTKQGNTYDCVVKFF